MKTFLKIIKGFFIFLGVIFFIILLFVAYLWFFDPLNIKPILFSDNTKQESIIDNNNISNSDAHPLLDDAQEKMVESLGINPSSLPTEITPAMEACFIDKLGAKRVSEIVNGDPISMTDSIKASSCLK
jgi:hypothetical protein